MKFESLQGKIIKQENEMMNQIKEIRNKNIPVVLFGAGNCGVMYVEILEKHGVKILCFCDDDRSKYGKSLKGINIISLEEVKKITENYCILISSYGPYKLLKRLQEVGLDKKFIFTEFYLFENGLDYYQFYMNNIEKLERVYNLLADEKSKKVFLNLINYKISRNIHLIEEVNDGEIEQYFDKEIIKFSDNEIFVDLGAYNGDTILRFTKKVSEQNGSYKKMFAFEPDKDTFNELKKNTENYSNVEYFLMGAYNQKNVLRFNSESFWTSAIDENGNVEIEVDALDNLIRDKVTFIKADIEGAELFALDGAKNIISQYKPKIAFCIYHKKEDIFEIPSMLHSLNANYKFYMRQYSEIPVESVLYAINKE